MSWTKLCKLGRYYASNSCRNQPKDGDHPSPLYLAICIWAIARYSYERSCETAFSSRLFPPLHSRRSSDIVVTQKWGKWCGTRRQISGGTNFKNCCLVCFRSIFKRQGLQQGTSESAVYKNTRFVRLQFTIFQLGWHFTSVFFTPVPENLTPLPPLSQAETVAKTEASGFRGICSEAEGGRML